MKNNIIIFRYKDYVVRFSHLSETFLPTIFNSEEEKSALYFNMTKEELKKLGNALLQMSEE